MSDLINHNERRMIKLNKLLENLAMDYINKHPEEAAKDIVKNVKEMNEDEE